MIYPALAQFSGLGLLLLRIVVGLVFISSGWSHLTKPKERSKSIEMPVAFTFMLGLGELLGGLGVILGFWIQPASLILVLVMLGAIGMKQFKWKIGFYDEKSNGWHYDALLLCANLVFLFNGGGKYALM